MAQLHNYKMMLAYDGTRYGGWQIQPNTQSIQSLVQDAVCRLARAPVKVIGSGRTDAGVHALAQIAHFTHDAKIDLYRFIASMNGLLPIDIRLLCVEEASLNFHARYSAIGKTYHYHLCLNGPQYPYRRLYQAHIKSKVDLSLLKQAAQLFIGKHDFTSFANEAHKGCAAKNAIRTIQSLNVVEEEEGIKLVFQADGFLYRMVRNIVGTMLEVGEGKRELETIPQLILAKDRSFAGRAAPAHGLFLAHVSY